MSDTPKPANKNWLLIKFRDYHTWLGVFLSGFIVMICVTGLYLNHKDLFESNEKKAEEKVAQPRPEKPEKEKGREKKSGEPREGESLLLTTTPLEKEVPIGFQQALARAEEVWGETALEHIQLKSEHGRLVYKIKQAGEKELIVDARSGEVMEKDGYVQKSHGPGEKPKEGYNWGKILKDLHTGKIADLPGKLLIDFTSVVIIFLTLTGIYLWVVPKYRKRKKEREQAAKKTNADPRPAAPRPAEVVAS
jgi:hypothetical protein